jgi:predicted aconitase
LSDQDKRMLDGRHGEGTQLAMRLIVKAAEAFGAERLTNIASTHLTSCYYNGQASVDFASRLVEKGAQVSVPTTLNSTAPPACLSLAGRSDLIREKYRQPAPESREGSRLMTLYTTLGGRPTFTCAPYQLPTAPKFGEHVAWAESNAVTYANSVIGARTNKYGEFIDICAAIVGRVPYVGLHCDENRIGNVVIRVRDIPEALFELDVFYHLLGYLVGKEAGDDVPIIDGLLGSVTKDQLRAIGATASVVSSLSLFHAVGLTPEAPTLAAACAGKAPRRTIEINLRHVREAREQLTSGESGALTAVCLGTPHMSFIEFSRIVPLLEGKHVHHQVALIITTSRFVRDQLATNGWLDICEKAGARIIVDTCSYIPGMLDRQDGVVLTNSGKWAYRAPSTLGVRVALGTTEECIHSSIAGRICHDNQLWRRDLS